MISAREFYRVDSISFATKTPTDMLDVPQSVQILTSQLIEDQAARDTTDLYRSISGIGSKKGIGRISARRARQDNRCTDSCCRRWQSRYREADEGYRVGYF
jgi:iron complex outermembrane receptor protein